MAVKFDANNEPYLQLPPPHSQFRLTPTRETDAPVVIAAMNDPSVYMNFIATPCPYLQQDWNAWFPILSNVTCKAVAELREVEEWKRGGMVGERKWVGAGQPFPAIRETDPETGEERFLGEVAIRRATFRQVKDEAEKKEMEERNLARKAGDPEIEWEMGCELMEVLCSVDFFFCAHWFPLPQHSLILFSPSSFVAEPGICATIVGEC